MVLLHVVFFAVSVFGIHISNAELTEPLVVHHACEGERFCDIKPHNYPQEEIDRLVIKHLPLLHRSRRNAPTRKPVFEDPSEYGNCRVTHVQESKPFTYHDGKGSLPLVLIQSKWFEQRLSSAVCSNENETCFQAFNIGASGRRFKCETKHSSSTFYSYDPVLKKMKSFPTNIDIGCVCIKA